MVQKEGTHALIANPAEIAYAVKNDPYYEDQKKPVFHFSQESLESYYVGWVTGKTSPWNKMLDDHIGLVLQVRGKLDTFILMIFPGRHPSESHQNSFQRSG